jgi:hypothetical protein
MEAPFSSYPNQGEFMFHLAAYTTAFAGAATLQDMTAAVDGAFTQRNGHLTFTSPMKLLAAHYTGALVTAAQLSVPSINAIAPHNIYPPNLAITELTNPNIQDLRDWPLQLPLEEEIAVQATASGAEQENAFPLVRHSNVDRRHFRCESPERGRCQPRQTAYDPRYCGHNQSG